MVYKLQQHFYSTGGTINAKKNFVLKKIIFPYPTPKFSSQSGVLAPPDHKKPAPLIDSLFYMPVSSIPPMADDKKIIISKLHGNNILDKF